MATNDRVYCRIMPRGQGIDAGYAVHILLPYSPTMDAADIRSSWPQVERNLEQAIRTARNEPEGTPLPAQLEDCLALDLTVDSWLVEDGRVDLFHALEGDIMQSIIAAVKGSSAS
jgi:hypothetical protein